jgi:ABC-type multidrug transport system fused ATPase/permease subunit
MPTSRASRSSGLRDLAGLLRPYAGRLALVVVILGALAGANMAIPFCLKVLIDEVLAPRDEGGRWELVWVVLPAIAAAYVARNAFFMASRLTSARIGADLCLRLRSRLFHHLQRMSLAFSRDARVGPVASRVISDTQTIQIFVEERLPALLLNAILLVALLVVISLVDWPLAIVSAIVLPLHFLTYRLFVGPIRRSHAQAQDHAAGALGSVVEGLFGMEVVKGFAGEDREIARFDSALDAARRCDVHARKWHVAQKMVADLLIGAATIALLGFGAWHVAEGALTVGAFFMFFGYVMMLYPTVLEVLSGGSHLTRAAASVDRVHELIRREAGEAHAAGADANGDEAGLPAVDGAVELRDVHFAYEDGREALRGLSFSIAAGEHVSIVGPSGIGKTTMASLIPRFNVAASGQVLVDGRDVRDWPLAALRRGIAVAFQEPFLFDASLLENVAYGRYDATVAEIVDVCRITGAHDFIDRLPVGYGTTPSRLGGSFSRGEKQRVTLARAILKDPRILILDEATASIDSGEAETIIRRVLERMRGRTVILITHDPLLACVADRIIRIAAPALPVESGA